MVVVAMEALRPTRESSLLSLWCADSGAPSKLDQELDGLESRLAQTDMQLTLHFLKRGRPLARQMSAISGFATCQEAHAYSQWKSQTQ